jgi:hypothetical protein
VWFAGRRGAYQKARYTVKVRWNTDKSRNSMGTEKRGTLKEVYTKVEVFRENIEKKKKLKKEKKEKKI